MEQYPPLPSFGFGETFRKILRRGKPKPSRHIERMPTAPLDELIIPYIPEMENHLAETAVHMATCGCMQCRSGVAAIAKARKTFFTLQPDHDAMIYEARAVAEFRRELRRF